MYVMSCAARRCVEASGDVHFVSRERRKERTRRNQGRLRKLSSTSWSGRKSFTSKMRDLSRRKLAPCASLDRRASGRLYELPRVACAAPIGPRDLHHVVSRRSTSTSAASHALQWVSHVPQIATQREALLAQDSEVAPCKHCATTQCLRVPLAPSSIAQCLRKRRALVEMARRVLLAMTNV